jgi:replicative DNA helicase
MKLPKEYKTKFWTAQSLVLQAKKRIEEIAGRKEWVAGTGFEKLDKITGWQPSDLIIIAARPAMGNCICIIYGT